MEKEQFDVWPMYNVKAKDEKGEVVERKASDNMGLLQWMEMKEVTASVFKVDIDKLEDKSIAYLKVKLLEEAWAQMKLFIQDSLGLIEKEEESVSPVEVEPDKPVTPEVVNPKPAATPEQPQVPNDEFFETTPEETKDPADKEIVL